MKILVYYYNMKIISELFPNVTTHFDQLQFAARWGLSPKTLERCRVNGINPKFTRLPGKVIYR